MSLATNRLQTEMQDLQGSMGTKQSTTEEQHGLLLAAQRKLYTQQSRLIDTVEVLRREVESVAVEQTLQVSSVTIAPAYIQGTMLR